MRHLTLAILALGLGGCVVVEGSGNIVSEMREVSGFDAVDVCCGIRLDITQGDGESLLVRGDDNILDDLDTYVAGRTLVIEYARHAASYHPTREVTGTIELIDLRRIDASGGSRVSAPEIKSTELSAAFSGGSSLDVGTMRLDIFNLDASGGSPPG